MKMKSLSAWLKKVVARNEEQESRNWNKEYSPIEKALRTQADIKESAKSNQKPKSTGADRINATMSVLTFLALCATIYFLWDQNRLISDSLARTDTALALTGRQIINDSTSSYRGDSLLGVSLDISKALLSLDSNKFANEGRPDLQHVKSIFLGLNNSWATDPQARPQMIFGFTNLNGGPANDIFAEVITFVVKVGDGKNNYIDSSTIDTLKFYTMAALPVGATFWLPGRLRKKPSFKMGPDAHVWVFVMGRILYRDSKSRYKTLEFCLTYTGAKNIVPSHSRNFFGDYEHRTYESERLKYSGDALAISPDTYSPEKYPQAPPVK